MSAKKDGGRMIQPPFTPGEPARRLATLDSLHVEHMLDGFCWCQPLVETGPLGDRLYIHRRSLDSPHIEAAR